MKRPRKPLKRSKVRSHKGRDGIMEPQDDPAKTLRSGKVGASGGKASQDPPTHQLPPTGDASQVSSAHAASPKVFSIDANERYHLEEEIARGGMGAVHRGRDELLGRDLAFKVLLESHASDASSVQRFIDEAQISGRLQHPGIVPIHELGKLEDDRPFFTMKLVKGQTLDELLSRRSDPSEDLGKFLGTFQQVCQTVAYAHCRGVIHRDLKPSNIMVGSFGEVQVMDWGVAKVLPAASDPLRTLGDSSHKRSVIHTVRDTQASATGSSLQTATGSVIGTPAYMPPEQAQGDIERLDRRADVFGLGAILCVVLTGDPPYVGEEISEILQLAAAGDLAACYARLAGCDADQALIDLARHCLAKDPRERPCDAQAVATQISDYLQSVADRLRQAELDRLEAKTKAQEERKRRRVSQALAASILATVIIAAGGGIWLQRQRAELAHAKSRAAEEKANLERAASRDALKAKAQAEHLTQLAEDANRRLERTLTDAFTARGLQAAEEGDGASAMHWFAVAAMQAGDETPRQYLNHLRARNWLAESIVPVGHLTLPSTAQTVEFQPAGRLLLVQRSAESYMLWDWQDDVVLDWMDGESTIRAACWSADGRGVAVATPNGEIEIRGAPHGKLLHSLQTSFAVKTLCTSRDGRYLALGGDAVQIWDAQAQRFLDEPWTLAGTVTSLAFNFQGTRLVAATDDQRARVYAVDDPSLADPLFEPLAHRPTQASPPAFVDRGQGLVTVTGRSRLAWWNAETGALKRRISTQPTWWLSRVVSDNGGDVLVCGGYYGPDIWRVKRFGSDPVRLDHVNLVNDYCISKDDSLLLTASLDRTAKIRSLPDGRLIRQQISHVVGINRIALSDDNRYIATAQANNQVCIWRMPSRDSTVALHHNWGERPRLSRDGRLVTPGILTSSVRARANPIQQVKVVNARTGAPACPPLTFPGEFVDSVIGSNNQSVTIVSSDNGRGWLTAWNVTDGRRLFERQLPYVPLGVAEHPHTDEFAVAGLGGEVTVVDVRTGAVAFDQPRRRRGRRWTLVHDRAEYTSDGRKIVHLYDDVVYVFDARTGRLCFNPIRPKGKQESPCRAFAISEDGRLLATCSRGAAQVWDLEDGSECCQPLAHPFSAFGIASVTFSRDGRCLLTANKDRGARIWDWKNGVLKCPPLLHEDSVLAVALTSDGRYAVTGSRGAKGGPHLWETTTGKPMAPSRKAPTAASGIAAVILTPDDTRLLATVGPRYDLAVFDLDHWLSSRLPPVEKLRLLGELATSRAIRNGDAVPMTLDEWDERWKMLRRYEQQ